MSKLKRPSTAWIDNAVKSVLTFGKKNATSLMTGGGIILGWAAVYVFWKQSKDAEKAIQHEEEKLSEEKGEPTKLPAKEKFIIYLQYCWLSALMGLGSTGLSLYSHKLDLDEIAKVYMLSQFYKDKSEETKEENKRLKQEIKPKKLQEVEDEILEKQYPKEEIVSSMENVPGEGNTLFIDKTTKKKFRGDIVKVTKGIMKADEYLRSTRRDMVLKDFNSRKEDPYFSSNGPLYNKDPYSSEIVDSDEFSHMYTAMSLDEFLEYIGEIQDTEGSYAPGLCELLEFRCYCSGYPALEPSEIMHYKSYTDPESGIPAVCFLDYTDLLSGSSNLLDRGQ